MPLEIRILTLRWMDGVDDAADLCAHGSAFISIGGTVVMDASSGDGWTLSAAALNLLRTLDSGYVPGVTSGMLIPCCGFNMYAADGGNSVYIQGCGSGIDWSVRHEGALVYHTAGTGEEAAIGIDDYRSLVLHFAGIIEDFYRTSTPKILPADKTDREGYQAFWQEWHSLKARAYQL